MKFTPRPNFPKMEEDIVAWWKSQRFFERSVEERPADRPYQFYDGPPFATGLPHYGHLVASLMKDMVPRFWTMKGYRVERRWGWDCHGLPIENIVEKELNLNSRKEIETYGVDRFNAMCESKVLMYAEEWKKTIARFGRWVDMENDYKTMDTSYMESIWWVFKALWDRGLIYEGMKAMHICPRCETSLSNFEVTLNYTDVEDLSVVVKFPLTDGSGRILLAWTTTPWSLPGNMFLAVNPAVTYTEVEFDGKKYVVAKDLVEKIFGGKDFAVVTEFPASDVLGKTYEPLFPYFVHRPNLFRVVAGDFVTTEDGTGIVHIAPAFGADDTEVGRREKVEPIVHVGMNGKFIEAVTDFADHDAKASDLAISDWISARDRLFSLEKIVHSYPLCWRCDTPLLNYTTSSWFVEVTQIKRQLLENNEAIHWVPEHIQHGRFGKWLEDAKDWAISRNRYWGTPLPIWQNVSDPKDVICVGSVKELETLSGVTISNLHRPGIDDVVIEKDGQIYRRVPEVLDCWFESGSMPYAQMHYPFEQEEKFLKSFPANFIAEGQDQTRGWFYTLHILATALTSFDNPAIPVSQSTAAFQNVIVNGIVLAEDGKKMSKRLKNYPEPDALFDQYGADSVRYYLATSPVMKADHLNFSEKAVAEIFRKFVLTLWNVVSFYKLYEKPVEKNARDSRNVLDQWILGKLDQLTVEVSGGYETYDLNRAARPLGDFVQELSTWYVRRSRDRFKKDSEDQSFALATLREILETFAKLMAPVMPFLAEMVYQAIQADGESVHLLSWPESREIPKEQQEILTDMDHARAVIESGHALRATHGMKVRQPLSVCETTQNLSEYLLPIVQEELNVKTVRVVKELSQEVVADASGQVGLDLRLTDELKHEGIMRELIRSVNDQRKKMGLTIHDVRKLELFTPNSALKDFLLAHQEEILSTTKNESVTYRDESLVQGFLVKGADLQFHIV